MGGSNCPTLQGRRTKNYLKDGVSDLKTDALIFSLETGPRRYPCRTLSRLFRVVTVYDFFVQDYVDDVHHKAPEERLRAPMSNTAFLRYTRYITIFQYDAIYRDIFTIFSRHKIGQKYALFTPKFVLGALKLRFLRQKCRILCFRNKNYLYYFFCTQKCPT